MHLRGKKLLEGNGSASSFELLLDRFRVFLGSGFLDNRGSLVNLCLSFLEAEAGDLTDNLDNVDLGRTSRGQLYVKLGLLSSRSSFAASSSTSPMATRSISPTHSSPVCMISRKLRDMGEVR